MTDRLTDQDLAAELRRFEMPYGHEAQRLMRQAADRIEALAANLDAIVRVCALAGVGARGQSVLCRVKDLHAALGQQIERADAAEAERDALLRFKQWVHAYLDAKGIPTHPDGPHGKEGCRIGDRMDFVFAEPDRLRALSADWRHTLNAVAAMVGHPGISPDEAHTASVAERVATLSRDHARLSEEAEARRPGCLEQMAASLEHHEEHHQREAALLARAADLEAALRPFADYAAIVHPDTHPANPIGDACPGLDGDFNRNARPLPTLGDCRNALALLQPQPEGGQSS